MEEFVIEDKMDIKLLEKVAADIHPALKRMDYDGWIVQFSEGYTQRANSVLPVTSNIETIASDYTKKVSDCEKLYAAKNLPCIFKMTEVAPEGLNSYLKSKKYKMGAPTNVMTVMPDDNTFIDRRMSVLEKEDTSVIITSIPDVFWLESFFKFEKKNDTKIKRIATRQFKLVELNKKLKALYCRVQVSGKDVAVASAVIEDGILFLLNVVVDEKQRKKGYGKILVKNILEAGCNMGAERLCLQVVADNKAAIKLYESFGFKFYYKYWYMVKQKK